MQRLQSGSSNANGIPFRDIPNYRFNDYIPQIPIDAYVDVLMYKQKLYEIRVKWLQDRIKDLNDLNYELVKHFNNETYNQLNQVLSDFIAKNLNGKRIDFADNYIFNQIVTVFKIQEKNIYEAYQFTISNINSIPVKDSRFYQTEQIGSAYVDGAYRIKVFDSKKSLIDTANIKTFIIQKDRFQDDTNKIVFTYSNANKSYFYVDMNELSGMQKQGSLEMKFLGNSESLFIKFMHGYLIINKGQNVNVGIDEGFKTFKSIDGSLSQYKVLVDNKTNTRFYISKEIFENGTNYIGYPIFAQ